MSYLSLLLVGTALAHKPSIGGQWGSPEEAFAVEDPSVSIVVYREITCENPELWLSFDATAGDRIWVQLGVPVIDRLEDYRPSMAVIAPGLPELAADEVPFEVPAGLGGVVLPARATPLDFYEPFTGTSSWVIEEEWLRTPESGPSWLVAWDPGRQTGKLWLAMGVVEDFSDVDWTDAAGWSEDVNDFHETGRYEPAPDVVEQVCLDVDPRDDGAEARGCETSHAPPSVSIVLLGLLGVLRRSPPKPGASRSAGQR